MHFIGDAVLKETGHVAPDELDRCEAPNPAPVGLPQGAIQLAAKFSCQLTRAHGSEDLAAPSILEFSGEYPLIVDEDGHSRLWIHYGPEVWARSRQRVGVLPKER